MTGRTRYWALLSAAACLMGQTAGAADPEPRAEGSLYPPSAEEIQQGPLAGALGPAAYILNDVGQSEDFLAAVRRAVGLNPSFHAQLAQRGQSRAGARRERAALYPRLSTSLSGDYVVSRRFNPGTDNVVESLRPNGQVNAGLSASQLLFDGGAAFQRIKSARARDRENANAVSSSINELSLDAISAYYDVLIHQAIFKLAEEFVRRHDEILESVKERERLGAGSRADVMRATARLAAAKVRVAEIRESERLAEIRYEEFFKETPGVLSRPSFDALKVNDRHQAMAMAAERHPDIAAAAARAEASRADYRAAKASRLPELRASVNAVKFDVFEGGEDFDVRAGVDLNYDLYAGGARGADIRQARERAVEQKYKEEQVRQDVERDAAIAFERRDASEERLRALETAVIANHESRDLVSERFRVARGDLIDVLQAENDYFEAGVAYLVGLADRDMATYELMEHTGELLRYFSPQREYEAALDGE